GSEMVTRPPRPAAAGVAATLSRGAGEGHEGAAAEPLSRTAGEGGERIEPGEGASAATIGSALVETAAALAAAGCEEPRRRARWVVGAALRLSAVVVFAPPERLPS